MRTLSATLLAAALAAIPLTTAAAPALHATTGTVKAVDATTLVVSRSKKASDDLTFRLNDTTRRDGAIVVGAPVSVRYQDEGKTHVATAVAVRPSSKVPTHQ